MGEGDVVEREVIASFRNSTSMAESALKYSKKLDRAYVWFEREGKREQAHCDESLWDKGVGKLQALTKASTSGIDVFEGSAAINQMAYSAAQNATFVAQHIKVRVPSKEDEEDVNTPTLEKVSVVIENLKQIETTMLGKGIFTGAERALQQKVDLQDKLKRHVKNFTGIHVTTLPKDRHAIITEFATFLEENKDEIDPKQLSDYQAAIGKELRSIAEQIQKGPTSKELEALLEFYKDYSPWIDQEPVGTIIQQGHLDKVIESLSDLQEQIFNETESHLANISHSLTVQGEMSDREKIDSMEKESVSLLQEHVALLQGNRTFERENAAFLALLRELSTFSTNLVQVLNGSKEDRAKFRKESQTQIEKLLPKTQEQQIKPTERYPLSPDKGALQILRMKSDPLQGLRDIQEHEKSVKNERNAWGRILLDFLDKQPKGIKALATFSQWETFKKYLQSSPPNLAAFVSAFKAFAYENGMNMDNETRKILTAIKSNSEISDVTKKELGVNPSLDQLAQVASRRLKLIPLESQPELKQIIDKDVIAFTQTRAEVARLSTLSEEEVMTEMRNLHIVKEGPLRGDRFSRETDNECLERLDKATTRDIEKLSKELATQSGQSADALKDQLITLRAHIYVLKWYRNELQAAATEAMEAGKKILSMAPILLGEQTELQAAKDKAAAKKQALQILRNHGTLNEPEELASLSRE